MSALVPSLKESAVDVRMLLLVALVVVAALGARALTRPFGESWSWAACGAVFLGGQNLAIVGRAGGFRRRPRAAVLFFVGAVSVGALLGYWVNV